MNVEASRSGKAFFVPVLAVAALLLALGPAAHAAGPAEPESSGTRFYSLVVTASKLDPDEQVIVIDVRALEESGAVTVADALRLTPEVVVLQYGARGSVDKIGLKGTGFTQALILVDGSPSPALGSAVLLDLPLSAVERIEIIKGRRSLGGAGAVNIVTKAAAAKAAAQVTSSTGFAARDIQLVDGGQLGEADFRVTASLASKPWALPGLYERRNYLHLRFDHELSPRSELSASVTLGVAERPGSGSADPAPSGLGQIDDAAALDISYAQELSRGILETKAFARIARKGAEILGEGFKERTSLVGGEVRATLEMGRSELTIGALAAREAGFSALASEPTDAVESRALFGELKQSLGQSVTAAVGAHAHFDPGFAPVLSPSIVISVSPLPQTTLRASAAHAYRPPSVSELRMQAAGVPKLQPEQGWRYELGLSREIGRGGIDLGVYEERLADRIALRPDAAGVSRPVNLSETVTRGVELGVRAALGGGLSSVLRWRSRDDRDAATGAKLPFIPSNEVKLGLYYTGASTRGNLELQLTGERLGASGASIAPQAVANGRIVHAASRDLDIFLEGYNLFDVSGETYGETQAISPGRTIMVGASLKF